MSWYMERRPIVGGGTRSRWPVCQCEDDALTTAFSPVRDLFNPRPPVERTQDSDRDDAERRASFSRQDDVPRHLVDVEESVRGGVREPHRGRSRGERAERDSRDVPGEWHRGGGGDRKSTRLNSSHRTISYAVFCLKK